MYAISSDKPQMSFYPCLTSFSSSVDLPLKDMSATFERRPNTYLMFSVNDELTNDRFRHIDDLRKKLFVKHKNEL